MKTILLPLDSLSTDTLESSFQTLTVVAQFPEKSTLENIYFISTVIIAFANILLIFYVFAKNNKKEISNNEKNRKIHLLKTLVLDYNMNKLYDFFLNVTEETSNLQTNNMPIEEKSIINDKIADLSTCFRQNFIDLFLAIDKNLYDDLLDKTDTLIDTLTNSIFDEGINLSHQPKFEELITKEIRESKTSIVNVLFCYSGE